MGDSWFANMISAPSPKVVVPVDGLTKSGRLGMKEAVLTAEVLESVQLQALAYFETWYFVSLRMAPELWYCLLACRCRCP